MTTCKQNAPTVRYHLDLDHDGRFVIEDYNHSKAFSNFFPGIAGLWGIPMWVFYVNRGQGISSFGIEGKDKAILEFQPANKAYRLTELQGFRTFIKMISNERNVLWEPFSSHPVRGGGQVEQRMSIRSYDLTIEEVNRPLGLEVQVNYFTMPQEGYPALIRHLSIENFSRKTCQLEIIDGLPIINAYGLSDWIMKNMSRTVEAWIQVRHVQERAPYFHLNVEVADTPNVKHIHEGNFYFAFNPARGQGQLLPAIVESECVFGCATDFQTPQRFLKEKLFRVPKEQQTNSRTPSAMSFQKVKLSPGEKQEIVSLIGFAHSEKELEKIVRQATAPGFISQKALQNRDIIAGIQNHAFTNSASREFNLYVGQTFLDNVLRGGLPVSLQTEEGRMAFNVFSRKHGDPERDYNYFLLAPSHFSQGNGNYRDVNQNRRNDVWFNQDVQDNGIVDFMSLIQADGYNPLVVKGVNFFIQDSQALDAILAQCVNGDCAVIRQRLQADFQPGDLLKIVQQNNLTLKVSAHEFLGRVLGACHKHLLAEHVEGYWSDHWTYNLDLIESYLNLYPDHLRSLLLERKVFYFYRSTHRVLPRDQRYVLTPQGVRQYHALSDDIRHVVSDGHNFKLCTRQGAGTIYYTTLIVKLLCLVANKTATFDPSGIGIEMEGGRPNWYDSLNGLPGLLGSSLNETIELKRLCVFLLEALAQLALPADFSISVFIELATFIRNLKTILKEEKDPTSFWHQANDIKEQYRGYVQKNIDGHEEGLLIPEIKDFLTLVIARVEWAVDHAKNKEGYLETYFRHDVVDYALLDRTDNGYPYVLPVKFHRHALPLFLEGFVHALRIERNHIRARELYLKLKDSPLFDERLKMYKNNADLTRETEEIGRTRIFPRGWLENESIWGHMEYKYLLELLRGDLHEEFYETFRQVLVPFMKPEVYGRSILENSSFLVSSAYQDESFHGRGFVARLSGITAELIQMWLIMNVGKRPFQLNHDQKVCLALQPVLAGWLFTSQETQADFINMHGKRKTMTFPKGTYAFNFLNKTLVVYYNPKRMNTYGRERVTIQKICINYPQQKKPIVITDPIIPHQYARDIRDNQVERMDVYFG